MRAMIKVILLIVAIATMIKFCDFLDEASKNMDKTVSRKTNMIDKFLEE
jgi:hypothetical protein